MRIGYQWNLLPLDPFHTNETISVHLLDVVFNKLVRLNSKGEIEPDLAHKWEISSDGKTYTFYLKDEIYFHNKAPFSSEDILASYRLLVSSKTDSPYAYIFKNVESISAPDPRSIIFVLKEPYSPFLFQLKDFYIVPQGAIQEGKGESFLRFGKNPIGTGPFQFVKWEGEDRYILERYPYYHERAAYLDKIIVQSYNSVEKTWAALMREEIDLMIHLKRDDFEVIKKDPTIKARTIQSVSFYYVLAYNHKMPLLSDQRFRLAIAHAINRQAIIDHALGGYGTLCNGPFLPDNLAAIPNKMPIQYNPKRSIQLLKEMGWVDSDDDGILEKDGKELEIELMYYSHHLRTIMALLLRQQLQEIGIKIKLKPVDYITDLGSQKLQEGNFEMELKTVKAYSNIALFTDWNSSFGNFARFYGFHNEKLDQVIAQIAYEANESKRRELLLQAHQLIYQEQPFTFLFFHHDFYAHKEGFVNSDEFFSPFVPFYTLKNWAQKSSAR